MIDRSLQMDEKSWWDFWNTSYRSRDQSDPTASELFTRAASIVNKRSRTRGCSVLEIGCGTGTLSRLLKVSRYQGLDISPAAIEIARRNTERLTTSEVGNLMMYEAADFHHWPLPPHLFDVVVCVDAIPYFRDPALALQKMAHSLAPSGTLALTAVNPFIYRRLKRTSKNPLQNGPVSQWLSRRELCRLIRLAGLTVKQSYTIMPRGNRGVLRLINSPKLNEAFGPRAARLFKRFKEQAGLGQYSVIVACKE